ncbi:MAG: metalloregulator ArsR/SmtB family transcription factor [Pseudomonadota bacterium]
MDEPRALTAFSALSNKSRLNVVRLLVMAGPGGMNAGAIAAALSASPSQTSFHLSTLAESGLVVSQRRARQIIYRVDFEAFRDLVGFLLEDCCQGAVRPDECC